MPLINPNQRRQLPPRQFINSKTKTSKQLTQLQNAIKACFSSYQQNLLATPIDLANIPGQDSKLLKFENLYHLIVDITIDFDSNVGPIYDLYEQCANNHFNEIALEMISFLPNKTPPSPIPSLDGAKYLIEIWNNFYQNVLPFLSKAFMYAERLRQLCSKRMMLVELTLYLFVKNVFDYQPRVSEYLTTLLNHGLVTKQKQIYDLLHNEQSINRDDYLISLKMDPTFQTISDLSDMLIILGNHSWLVHYKMFQIPFLQEHCPGFLSTMADEFRKTIPVLDYVKFVRNYLEMQNWLLEDGLSFPKEFVEYFYEYSSHELITNNIEDLFLNEELDGFKIMLEKRAYSQMMEVYSIICDIHKRIRLKTMVRQFESLIEKILKDRLKTISEKYYLDKRHTCIEFTRELFQEHDHWDRIQAIVFKNARTTHLIIMRYFLNILKINEHVTQALAYFMHELLLKDSDVLAKIEIADLKRLELLRKLYSMIVYIKDVNQFYDFTKHYFAIRLLTSSSALPLMDEMEQLNQMNSIIRNNYVTNPSCLNDIANLEKNHYKQLIQNLNDFNSIASDYHCSTGFFTNCYNVNRRRPPPTAAAAAAAAAASATNRKFLSSCSILHSGIWKLVEYDQCWMPKRITKSFKEFEKCFSKQNERKKLLINTKYSQAHVSMVLMDEKEFTLIVTLHQYAIIDRFNQHDHFKYDSLLRKTKFQKEYNLRIALLSLIYCGLIRCPQFGEDLEQFIFEINEENFPKLLDSKVTSKNLSGYEQVNFLVSKPLDNTVDHDDFVVIVLVLSGGKDLAFLSSKLSVEETNLTNILNKSSQFDVGLRKGSPSADTEISSIAASSTSNDFEGPGICRLTRSESRWKRVRVNSQSKTKSCLTPDLSNKMTTSGTESPRCIERLIKIEAAIVRVLKRLKRLPSFAAIQQAVNMELNKKCDSQKSIQRRRRKSTQLMPGTPLVAEKNSNSGRFELSMEDVRKGLLRLIEKKYVKRAEDGSFEYQID